MEKISYKELYSKFEEKFTMLIIDFLKKENIFIKNVEIFKIQNHVNFLLTGFLKGKKIIIKCSFFGRSLLYLYELFSKSESIFIERINQELGKKSINKEANAMISFSKNGLKVPRIYYYNSNIIIYEFLDDTINLDKYIENNINKIDIIEIKKKYLKS